MAHSNSTTNYNLPQFISTDKPAWLTDINTAYSDIDAGMHNAQVAANSAQSDATQALSDASAASTTATSADAKASGVVASISESFDSSATYSVGDYVVYNNLLYVCTVAITTPGSWTGSANWTRTTLASELTTTNSELDTLDTAVSSKADSSLFNNMFKTVHYVSDNISLGAGSATSFTASAMGITAVPGYTPISFKKLNVIGNGCSYRFIDIGALESGAFIVFRNNGSSTETGNVSVDIVYVKSDFMAV